MNRRFTGGRVFLGAVALAVGFAAIAAGCGGSSHNNKTTASQPTTTPPSSTGGQPAKSTGKAFPVFRVTWDQPDYFDPGLAYTVAAWQVMWNVYDGLLGYKHAAGAAGATLVPYLAQSMPKISADGKVYKFTLRPGLKYSNGKPVKASDFASTIERDYQIDSPGVGFFSVIEGADAYGKLTKSQMKGRHIPGIKTNDSSRTITITLTHPEGDFMNILATMFGAFVPSGTPASDQSNHPTPATGPYMIQSYTPMRGFTLVRNPYFKSNHIPDQPAGNPDKVVGTIITDGSAALQSVLSGNSDYDYQPIPNDRLPTVQSKYSSQLKFYTPANMYYFFLNERTKPFNNLEVRQAVNYAIDRKQLVSIFGGLGRTTQNVLPPNYPQYNKIQYYKHDLAKAKALVKQSGLAGTHVTVWGDNTPPSAPATEYLASVLRQIGFKTSVRVLAHGVYFTTIGNQATKAQTGWADWYQDYPNPIDWFDVLFNGRRITQTHNNNYGNVDFPDVNRQINSLKQKTGANAAGWAKVGNELITKHAALVPYLNRVSTDFFSSKVDTSCYINHVLYQFDFSTICMK
jgi:peptide/nickel transport system substrate-binding protein